MRSCAGKALAPSAKVGIPIQVTQSFWIVVPSAFSEPSRLCFQTLLTTSLQLGMLPGGSTNIFGTVPLIALLTVLLSLLALLTALLALLKCSISNSVVTDLRKSFCLSQAALSLRYRTDYTRRWGCASFCHRTSHPPFSRSGLWEIVPIFPRFLT